MPAVLLLAAALLAPPSPAPVALTPEVVAKLKEIAFQAARDGDGDTLRHYFESGRPVNEVNARGDTLLTVAAYNKQEAAVEVILKQKGVEIDARNKMGLTALSGAAFKGDAAVCKRLLAAGAGVNAASRTNQTALMFASLSGKLEVVELLLAAGADPKAQDKAGNTPLSLAKGQGAEAVAKRLEGAGASLK